MRIVIPTNNETCWRECVKTIRKNEPFVDPAKNITAVLDMCNLREFKDVYSYYTHGSTWNNIIPGKTDMFCFSSNVNWGIRDTGIDPDGIIILNHDALLETPGGFSSMIASCPSNYGVVSAAVRGACCNPAQEFKYCDVSNHNYMEDTDNTVAFVCVYIPRRTLDLVGLLDERLVGYGRDDDLYCLKVRRAGLKIGVWHGCVVEHNSLPSSYRTRSDCGELADYNLKVFAEIVREEGLEPWLSEDQKASIARGHNI